MSLVELMIFWTKTQPLATVERNSMNWRKCVGSFRADISLKPWCVWLLKWDLRRLGFTLCGDLVFLNGFCKTISDVNRYVIIVWWKCSASYLVCCVFDKVHVILESKRVQTSLKLIPIFAVVYLGTLAVLLIVLSPFVGSRVGHGVACILGSAKKFP